MLLLAQYLFDDYRAVSPDFLRSRGVTLLLADLDYTLAPRSVRRPDDALRAWIGEMKERGVTVMIVSNNRSSRRVEEFCRDLGIAYQGHAGKPSARGLYAAMARAGATREQTAMLGDKLLTDVLAGNRAGVLTLMVEPLGGPVGPWNRFLHLLQEPFKAAVRRSMAKSDGGNG